MSNVRLSCPTPEAWQALLADPGKHWRDGYSAKTLAYSWLRADGFPAEVAAVLHQSPPFASIEMLLGVPEHQVPLPGGRRASQSDIWVLARVADGFVSIAVEGKVAEPFDRTVREWFADESPGKRERLAYLAETLGQEISRLNEVRYQLLHRTASAIIEARRFGAAHAVMLVHSFSPTREHFGDFAALVALYDHAAAADNVISVGAWSGVQLHFAWVTGQPTTVDLE